MRKYIQPEFWITNISNTNVCLADLALTVPKGRSFNLLDSKRFHYTEEQILASAESGSLFKKSAKIRIRDDAPVPQPKKTILISQYPIKGRIRSTVKIEIPKYEELNFSDEQFANEFSGDLLWDPNKPKK